MRRAHANQHFGAIEGEEYWVTHDNRRHARSTLHGRINATGNHIVATIDAVPYTNVKECQKRVKMNAIHMKHRVKWRFRTKKPRDTHNNTTHSVTQWGTPSVLCYVVCVTARV
eukprot:6350172-Prymnesium_polylepis.1